ncbi:Na+/H+ antiporter subunit E [Clostridiaceae bacterium HSG29]|nr:Na+/H+ antiporter subunit E [Clostridiaceae bacterium HSG29]
MINSKKIKKLFKDQKLIAGLAIFWFLLTGEFTVYNVVIGFSIILLIVYVSDVILGDNNQIPEKINIFNFMIFIFNVIVDIDMSSVRHIVRIVKNNSKPYVFHLKLNTDNTFVASLIANAITLTPGTITLEVSDDLELKILTMIEKEEEIDKLKKNIINRYEKVLMKGEEVFDNA